jgi:hypothetical protein
MGGLPVSINGRINVDCLFHDTESTTSFKVVSLDSSDGYTQGKVAIVTGTVGTASVTIDATAPLAYRDASGEAVSFSSVSRVAFMADSACTLTGDASDVAIRSHHNYASVTDGGNSVEFTIAATAGTATYRLLIYGT